MNQVVPSPQPMSRVIYCSIGGYKRSKLRLMHRPGTVEGVCSIQCTNTSFFDAEIDHCYLVDGSPPGVLENDGFDTAS